MSACTSPIRHIILTTHPTEELFEVPEDDTLVRRSREVAQRGGQLAIHQAKHLVHAVKQERASQCYCWPLDGPPEI
jgi:hypothetical protein